MPFVKAALKTYRCGSFFLISTEITIVSILPIFSVFAVAGLKLIPAFQAIYHAIASIQGRIQHLNNIRDDLELIYEEAVNQDINNIWWICFIK